MFVSLLYISGVLVHPGYCNKIPQIRWLINDIYFSQFWRLGSPKSRLWHFSIWQEPTSRWTASLYDFNWPKGQESFSGCLYGLHPLDPITFPKAPLLKTLTLGVIILTYEFWGAQTFRAYTVGCHRPGWWVIRVSEPFRALQANVLSQHKKSGVWALAPPLARFVAKGEESWGLDFLICDM